MFVRSTAAIVLASLLAAAALSAEPAGKKSRRKAPARTPALSFEAANDPATAPPLRRGSSGSAVLRAQVLLDRARFSPGEIDGSYGSNVWKTVAGFQKVRGLPATGNVDEATWKELNSGAETPALARYTIRPEDVAGPFHEIPEDMMAKASLPALSYSSPLELLAEKFHASPKLLTKLNPGKSFDKAGEEILVPNVHASPPGQKAAKVVVDKTASTVTAVDGNWFDFHERALERVAELPGVEGAAFAWGVPLTGNSWPGRFEVEGYTVAAGNENLVSVPIRAVTAGYFSLLGQTIEEGRDFRSADRVPPPNPATPNVPPDPSSFTRVAVVNRAFVEQYLGGAGAIGKKIWSPQGPNRVPMDIVGVVSDTRTVDLARASEPEVYVSLLQQQAFSKHLVVRTTESPTAIVGVVERELKTILPTVAVEYAATLEQIRDRSLASRTFAMQLLVGFAVVAVVLTLAGVYSVLSLTVTARRRELAIRTAVGADARRIMGLVLRSGLKLIAAGIVVGVAVSFALSRVLQAMLFEVGRADPLTLTAAAAAFAAVALLACALPALRAARVDPAEALKGE